LGDQEIHPRSDSGARYLLAKEVRDALRVN
jgi:hypothetical protein